MSQMNVARTELRPPVQEQTIRRGSNSGAQPAADPSVVVLALPSDVAPAADIAKTLGIPPDAFVVRRLGAPQRESHVATLLAKLEGHRPDLLVRDNHHPSMEIGKCLSGTVTEQLFRKVRRPVLVYGSASSRNAHTPVRNILYATDLSIASVSALHSAYDVARNHDAKLVVLEVTSEPNEEMLFDDAVTTAFEKLQDWLHNHVFACSDAPMGRAQCLVKFGEAAQQIVETANELHPEMIVIGARGRGAGSEDDERFVGDTAYAVACSAECPVLIVPDLTDLAL
jgi:nucleotide-binding universal stress UspA family protein